MSMLQFRVECKRTKPGQAVYVVGNVPELGSWKVESGVPCMTTAQSFPMWTSPDVVLKSSKDIEFKLVVANEQARSEDGTTNFQLSRTPSIMLIDADEFFAEAAAEEQHVLEMEPGEDVLLQAFNWESHQAGRGDWYSIVGSKIDMFKDACNAGHRPPPKTPSRRAEQEMGITDLWLPPCSASVAPQGYLPSQLFNIDGSKYGNKASLQQLLKQLHEAGLRGVADIVINHRCGDQQDAEGRWNVFTSTGPLVLQRSWRCRDARGARGPLVKLEVQKSIEIWLRWLRLELGFDAWRFDFVKGYGAQYVGKYCEKSEPAWAVGELWLDMAYDDNGLCYNQDRHRQDTINWINGTGKASTAFDFTTKGILQEAVRNCQYWRLKDARGKPPGLLGWMPSHAVTFLDNHDTGSTQAHWPFPNDKIMVGYAYILTHPGIPSIFWDHLCDWGDDVRNKIGVLLKLRKDSGMQVDAPVKILIAENDLYLAEIGSPALLRVALGPKVAPDYDRNYWEKGGSGHSYPESKELDSFCGLRFFDGLDGFVRKFVRVVTFQVRIHACPVTMTHD
eukprot:g6330.t1